MAIQILNVAAERMPGLHNEGSDEPDAEPPPGMEDYTMP